MDRIIAMKALSSRQRRLEKQLNMNRMYDMVDEHRLRGQEKKKALEMSRTVYTLSGLIKTHANRPEPSMFKKTLYASAVVPEGQGNYFENHDAVVADLRSKSRRNRPTSAPLGSKRGQSRASQSRPADEATFSPVRSPVNISSRPQSASATGRSSASNRNRNLITIDGSGAVDNGRDAMNVNVSKPKSGRPLSAQQHRATPAISLGLSTQNTSKQAQEYGYTNDVSSKPLKGSSLLTDREVAHLLKDVNQEDDAGGYQGNNPGAHMNHPHLSRPAHPHTAHRRSQQNGNNTLNNSYSIDYNNEGGIYNDSYSRSNSRSGNSRDGSQQQQQPLTRSRPGGTDITLDEYQRLYRAQKGLMMETAKARLVMEQSRGLSHRFPGNTTGYFDIEKTMKRTQRRKGSRQMYHHSQQQYGDSNIGSSDYNYSSNNNFYDNTNSGSSYGDAIATGQLQPQPQPQPHVGYGYDLEGRIAAQQRTLQGFTAMQKEKEKKRRAKNPYESFGPSHTHTHSHHQHQHQHHNSHGHGYSEHHPQRGGPRQSGASPTRKLSGGGGVAGARDRGGTGMCFSLGRPNMCYRSAWSKTKDDVVPNGQSFVKGLPGRAEMEVRYMDNIF